jgi:hypothetical protein
MYRAHWADEKPLYSDLIPPIQVGDFVVTTQYLTGPYLEVHHIDGEAVTCVFYDQSGFPHSAVLNVRSLTHYLEIPQV